MNSDNEHWASISDMMSGLMIIFLFISVAYMNSVSKANLKLEEAKAQAEAARKRIESIAESWDKVRDDLYEALYREFKDDLNAWQAHIDRETLSVKFYEPSVYFKAGSSELTEGFRNILADFFPRYMNILGRYRECIAEVRIEGHTSSEWGGGADPLTAYFRNMKLSQDRTRAVLQYCLGLPQVLQYQEWAMRTITAAGMSSGRVVKSFGHEDAESSRRVEFRVRIDSDSRILEILGGRN